MKKSAPYGISFFNAPVTVLWVAIENLQLCEVDVEPKKYSNREE